MTTYLLRRALGAVPLVIGVSIIVFGILQGMRGGPLAVYLDNPYTMNPLFLRAAQ